VDDPLIALDTDAFVEMVFSNDDDVSSTLEDGIDAA